jgi:hypothetical protein
MNLHRLVLWSLVVGLLACTKPCIKDPIDIDIPEPPPTCNTWSRLWGGTDVDVAWAVAKTPDGGYIVAGNTYSADEDVEVQFGSGDISIIRFNSLGVKLWQRSYGTANEETAAAIVKAPAGGGYVVLSNQSTSDGHAQLYIFSINEEGDKGWETTWQGPGYTSSNALLAYGNEYMIVASSSTTSDVQPYFLKLDLLGNIIAEQTFGNPMRSEFPNSIIPAHDGGYLVTGYTIDGAGEDAWTVKLNFFGDWEWERFTSGSDVDEWMDAIPAADGTGDYILVGQSNSIDGDLSGNHGDYDVMIARIGPVGNIKWRSLLGGSADELGLSVIKDVDGNYVIAGTTRSGDGSIGSPQPAAENRGAWIFKIDGTGKLLSQKVVGGSQEDYPTAITNATDCGILLVGFSLSNDGDLSGNHKAGIADAWVAKISL